MTLSQKRRLLNEAISSKRAITFVYRGEDFNRIGNPHAFGYGSDNTNNTYLRFYQTAGGSSRPLLEIDPKGANFRLMLVDEMEDIEILNEEFEPHEHTDVVIQPLIGIECQTVRLEMIVAVKESNCKKITVAFRSLY